jgi:hypothetical protein
VRRSIRAQLNDQESTEMETSGLDRNVGASNTLAVISRMNAYERAQAQVHMEQGVALAEFVLATVGRLRDAIDFADRAVTKAFGGRSGRVKLSE